MKGLELSRKYFEYSFDMVFEGDLQPVKACSAAGLCGEGSECFGFDDGLSYDHDYSPDYCIWIPDKLYKDFGKALEAAYAKLPAEFEGIRWERSERISARRGVQTVEGYFQKYTGLTHMPETNTEWMGIPESFLAVAVNGEIFKDYCGAFSRWRAHLKKFYPEDVFRKKLAARAGCMAQSGQYNYIRCIKRNDAAAAYLAGHEFVINSLSAVYLLNRQYMPFYKWSFFGARRLGLLKNVVSELEEFADINDSRYIKDEPEKNLKVKLINKICERLADELRRQGLSAACDGFLLVHGAELIKGISDDRLRNMNIFADVR